MTVGTNNEDQTFVVRGTSYTITQDHTTGFWSVSDPVQVDTPANELFGLYTTRELLKIWVNRVG